MMKPVPTRFGRTAACAVAAFLLLVGTAHAESVAVFDNPNFVDTGGTASDESDTVQATLISLGHTVNTITGFTASAWAAAGTPPPPSMPCR